MITPETLSGFRNWFSGYVKGFQSQDPEYQEGIRVKEAHTKRVCQEILDIGGSLGLDEADLRLAQVVALFHDIGRFEQYHRYGTYLDARSEDHALLGVAVLRKSGILDHLGPATRDLILRTTAYHNRPCLPEGESERILLFTKLLRDADKLDIWRVVTEYYRQEKGARYGAVGLGLPDTPEISHGVWEDLMSGRTVRLGSLKTLNDFKLLQMAWIYDVNFPRSFQRIQERGYLESLVQVLPPSKKVEQVYSRVKSYLSDRAGQGLTRRPLGPKAAAGSPSPRSR